MQDMQLRCTFPRKYQAFHRLNSCRPVPQIIIRLSYRGFNQVLEFKLITWTDSLFRARYVPRSEKLIF